MTPLDREASGTLPLPAFGNREKFRLYHTRLNETEKIFLTGTMGSDSTSVVVIINNVETVNGGNFQEHYIRPVFCI